MRLISHPTNHPSIRVETTEDSLVLHGVLRDQDTSSWLCPLIDETHHRALRFQLPEVKFDLRRVEYANASAWKCLVYWIRKLREDEHAKYTLRILCNRAYRWQEVGMAFLRTFEGAQLVIDLGGDERPVE